MLKVQPGQKAVIGLGDAGRLGYGDLQLLPGLHCMQYQKGHVEHSLVAGLQRVLESRFHTNRLGKVDLRFKNAHKVNFIRYADDFIVTAATEEIALEAKQLLKEFLAVRGLELSDEKTVVTHIDNGFDFLGWTFRKFKGKLIIKPSKS